MTDSSPDSPANGWVLVTGGSRGLGRAMAEAIARMPYHVVINYRSNHEQAAEVVESIRSAGGSAESVAFDVADPSACRTISEELLERLGTPWAVINNAGVVRDGLMVWMQEEDWRDVLRTNLDSFYNVTHPYLKAMLTARQGRILNITSTAGQVGNPGQVNYSASKAGLIGATMALAKEVAKRNITVNAVAPGFIETDMTADLPVDTIKKTIPAGRFGSAEEVAAVVTFLLAERSSYVTGQTIGVNGGLH